MKTKSAFFKEEKPKSRKKNGRGDPHYRMLNRVISQHYYPHNFLRTDKNLQ